MRELANEGEVLQKMQCFCVFVANNALLPSQTSLFIAETQFLNNQLITYPTLPKAS